MSKQTDNYSLLIEKLDSFIRKYYINKLIRGGLLCLGLVLATFLIYSLLEYYFYFGQGIRKFFFYSFIAVFSASFVLWVLIPLFKYFRLGSTISHSQAANIIGKHFKNVNDKLLNILQLKSQNNALDSKLIEASIDQKSEEIKLVPFRSAIDFSNNRRYLKYALPPFLLLLVFLFAAPSLITESTNRIIKNNEDFEPDAPFSYVFEEDNFEVVQFQDYDLNVKIEGSVLPQEVFIDVDNFQYKLQKLDDNLFSYRFNNVQKDLSFEVFSGRVKSGEKSLDVIEKPNITDFTTKLDYPAYVGRKDEFVNNVGDLTIPQGTKVIWSFNTNFTDDLSMKFDSEKELKKVKRSQENSFSHSKRLMRDDYYKILLSNDRLSRADSLMFSINVQEDQFPEISVEKFEDSLETQLLYFIGNAADDYGLTDIRFNYAKTDVEGKTISASESILIPENKQTEYAYTLDLALLELKPGDQLSYYFEAFDNDGVNGIKSSKTPLLSLRKPTIEEFEAKEDENEEDIKEELTKVLEDSKKLREELKKAREKLLQKKELSWQDKKELEELIEKQKEIEEKIQKAKEKFEENLKNQEEINEQNEEILEKQEQLQELFEQSLDEETMELMEKIQELMDELDKEEMMEMMEDMEMDEKAMEKNMDRLLELFKQLEVEKEIQEQLEKLEELAKEQEELSEETKKEDADLEEIQKEQEKINEEFEKIKEDMKELEKKNEELEVPKDMGEDNEEKMEEIKDDLMKSQQELQKQEKNKASKSQKKASEKMKQMAGGMQQQMASGEMEQMQEDMEALKQLLENLITISFDQETLVDDIKITNTTTPRYVSLIQEQFKLKDDFSIVEDSLLALAKRIEQIAPVVTEKLTEIEQDMSSSIELLEDRKKDKGNEKQRGVMKNVNDLALMLDDAMQQMQQSMSSMMSGNQMCNKPGASGKGKSGKVPMDKITKGQEELQKDLQKMMEGQKEGKGNSSKSFAEAAARQAALRKALEEMQKGKQELGKGSKELQDIIDQMDKVEIDLVNKRLNNDLLRRQQQIKTRLLQAENAERQRDKDQKRKAERGKDKKKELPPPLLEYLKKKEAETDLYKTISPELRPYYRQMVDEYYKALKGTKSK